MKQQTKIKVLLLLMIIIIIPFAVYLDYIYFGYKNISGYLITCCFELLIFFSGIAFGEWNEKYNGGK